MLWLGDRKYIWPIKGIPPTITIKSAGGDSNSSSSSNVGDGRCA